MELQWLVAMGVAVGLLSCTSPAERIYDELVSDERYDQAYTELTELIDDGSTDADAYFFRGNVLLDLEEPKAALDDYRMALVLDPDLTSARFNLGIALLDMGSTPAALEHYTVMAEEVTDDPNVYYNLGHCHLELSNWQGAADAFRKGLDGFDDADCCFGVAYAYDEAEQLDSAQHYYHRTLELQPDMYEALVNRAIIYNRWGQFQKALPDIEEAVAMTPDDAECLYELGRTHNGLKTGSGCAYLKQALAGGWEEAREELEKHCGEALLTSAL